MIIQDLLEFKDNDNNLYLISYLLEQNVNLISNIKFLYVILIKFNNQVINNNIIFNKKWFSPSCWKIFLVQKKLIKKFIL